MLSAGAAEVRSRRAIGQAFNHTETMRDMIPLDKPVSRMAVAATLQRGAPPPVSQDAETVTCRGCRRYPPPGCGRTRSCGLCRTQKHQRRANGRGGEIE